jgi:hypothetical protein
MANEPKLDKAKITEELERLQLEETQERVHQIRTRREGLARRIASRQNDLTQANRRRKAKEVDCWHKKGGKGVENLARGTDHNYAVIKHQLSHGPIIVICQRCGHVAEPPPVELNARKATPEQKAEYKRLYEEYMWWVNLPTDNVMSGTQIFMVVNDNEAA